MRQTKNSNKNWSWTLFPQTILWWVEVKTCHFHLHLVVTQNDWAWYEDSTSQGSQKSVIPYHFPSFPICYTTPTIEITSRALGSQTLFCWHLSRGWCSTWFPDWPNLAGKIWVKCSWTLFGGGFFKVTCLGKEMFGRELRTKNLWGLWVHFEVVRVLESLMSDSFTEGCPSPSSPDISRLPVLTTSCASISSIRFWVNCNIPPTWNSPKEEEWSESFPKT